MVWGEGRFGLLVIGPSGACGLPASLPAESGVALCRGGRSRSPAEALRGPPPTGTGAVPSLLQEGAACG